MARNESLVTDPNLMSIWYHDHKVSIDTMRQMKKHLYKNFSYSRVFSKKENLLDYLGNKLVIKRTVLILSMKNKKEAESIAKLVKNRGQRLDLCLLPRELHVGFSSANIDSAHSHIEKSFNSIVEELLKQTAPASPTAVTLAEEEKTIKEEAVRFDSFNTVPKDSWLYDLNIESLKFLLFQSLIEILIRKEYDENSFQHMWRIFREDYANDPVEINRIQQYAETYEPHMAIYYYTQNSCLFRLISKAFRMEDVERLYRFGCYLSDLHEQLEQTENNQRLLNQIEGIMVLYRGKRISMCVLQQLKDSIGHVIALNGLLSTSTSYNIARIYAGDGVAQGNYQSAIFEIHVDFKTMQLIRPYADVTELSAMPDENEVLFFTGFVWRVESMNFERNYWKIKLQSCTDEDNDLIKHIKETRRNCSYLTVGKFLTELGDHAQASNFYERMLTDEKLTDEIRCDILVHQAMLAEDQGEYLKALKYLKEVERLVKLETASNLNQPLRLRPLFAHKNITSKLHIFYNMGVLYWKDANSKLARQYFEAALQQKGSDDELATVLNSYGRFEFGLGNIEQAHNYLQQAVQVAKDDDLLSDCTINLSMIRRHV
ncbi:unnamed protein product [Rotaria socialis]|uniref:NAD(P)(+)--arginine ADP-ribosyltransferase n=1 Tax=Rotaria socialis TaxID=392032 RepID=A0A818V4U6_9BILA|nr:unnamed protein product [Rotaria socialis]CAF3706044.1 unnamed protein product [Rotaria socialis]CAF4409171.1 unnamed protein product [Rotaria socialis]CAF4783805.1 unnamed protein product [Rotaria socialis]